MNINTKLKKQIKEQLLEQKQVGTLYHFTSIEGQLGIQNTNSMLLDYDYEIHKNVISFTRNKNLNFNNNPFVFVIDGNKLSNNYKIEPYSDPNWDVGENKVDTEAEERIVLKQKNEIPNINKYIINVIINKDKIKSNLDKLFEEIDPEQGIIREELPNIYKFLQYYRIDWNVNNLYQEINEIITIQRLRNYITKKLNVKIIIK